MESGLGRTWHWLACIILAVLLIWPGTARAASCASATSQGNAPPGWQTYCWLDLSDYNDATARTAGGQLFTINLPDGSRLTFTARSTGTAPPALAAIAAPSWTGAAVGNTAFLGIPGRPILYQQAGGTNVLSFSNILITPPPGIPAVTAYSFVAADAESTNEGETLAFTTNGSGWTILDQVNPISGNTYPAITGTGTATFTETGVPGTVGGYIVGSNGPTTVSTRLVGSGLQGAMFAVRFASIRLTKVISGARASPADQFKFDIASTSSGTVLGSGTTSGTGLGPFAQAAVSLASGIPLTLRETMAAGSVNDLSHYRSVLNCTNNTTGSATALPSNVVTTSYDFGALQFGDAVACVFTNTPFPHLTLRKALGASGRRFASDQFIVNVTSGATVVATATTTGTGATVATGTTPQIQVMVGQPYGLSEAPSGSTNLAQYGATLACINAATSATALPNVVGGSVTPAMGDVITCTITNTANGANATLTALKTSVVISDPTNGTTDPKAVPGAIVRYTITVTNTGTLAVDANTVALIDRLPATMTYNAASPVTFVNGSPSSGLNTFNASTMVSFSSQAGGGAPFTYTPNTAGYDANVKGVRIAPSGTMAGATAAGQPSFSVSFLARVN